ncbi:hypothetical protein HHK36_019108 [Tetracentron sinense]|uniref:Protein FAR1-RELATED SEQUENCE n=1 Tax=Tetracentron sinense TaxID=13715 RepID=A0A834Z1N3_TETSI|nr:hypothetical protein HHK36_019108 [Tetracentron sinense]
MGWKAFLAALKFFVPTDPGGLVGGYQRVGRNEREGKERKFELGSRVEPALKAQEPAEGIISALRKEPNGIKIRVEQDFGAFGRWQDAVVCSVGGPQPLDGWSEVALAMAKVIRVHKQLILFPVDSNRAIILWWPASNALSVLGLSKTRWLALRGVPYHMWIPSVWNQIGQACGGLVAIHPSAKFFTDLEVAKIQVQSELRDISRFISIEFHSISYPVEVNIWGHELCGCGKSEVEAASKGAEPRGKTRLEVNPASLSLSAKTKKSETIFLNSNCCPIPLKSGDGNVRNTERQLLESRGRESTKVRWQQKVCVLFPAKESAISDEEHEIPGSEGSVLWKQEEDNFEEALDSVRRPLNQVEMKRSDTGSKFGRVKKKRNSLRRLRRKKAMALFRSKNRVQGGEDKVVAAGCGSGSGLSEVYKSVSEPEQPSSKQEAQVFQGWSDALWASNLGPVGGILREWSGPSRGERDSSYPLYQDGTIRVSKHTSWGFRSFKAQGDFREQVHSSSKAFQSGDSGRDLSRGCWSALELMEKSLMVGNQMDLLSSPAQMLVEEDGGVLRRFNPAVPPLSPSLEQMQVDSDPFDLAPLIFDRLKGKSNQSLISSRSCRIGVCSRKEPGETSSSGSYAEELEGASLLLAARCESVSLSQACDCLGGVMPPVSSNPLLLVPRSLIKVRRRARILGSNPKLGSLISLSAISDLSRVVRRLVILKGVMPETIVGDCNKPVEDYEVENTMDGDKMDEEGIDEIMQDNSELQMLDREKSSACEPMVGMEFDSVDAAKEFYNKYAKRVNHRRLSILFACGLIAYETEETFVWLFEVWLEAMSRKIPISINKAMKVAIATVFPSTIQRFCKWHILNKLPEKLNHVYQSDNNFGWEFRHCIENVIIDDFERDWKSLLEKYSLCDNEWLKSLYDECKQWIPAYMRDIFCRNVYQR